MTLELEVIIPADTGRTGKRAALAERIAIGLDVHSPSIRAGTYSVTISNSPHVEQLTDTELSVAREAIWMRLGTGLWGSFWTQERREALKTALVKLGGMVPPP